MNAGTWIRPITGRRFHFAPRGGKLSLCGVVVSNAIDERAGVSNEQACMLCVRALAKKRAEGNHADPQE